MKTPNSQYHVNISIWHPTKNKKFFIKSSQSRDWSVRPHSEWDRNVSDCVSLGHLTPSNTMFLDSTEVSVQLFCIDTVVTGGAVAQWVELWTCDQYVAVSSHTRGNDATLRKNLGQVVYTYVPLSPSSITWYRPKGGDAVKVTAGLAESIGSLPPGGWLTVTCRLTALHLDQLRAQRSVSSMGKPLPCLYLLFKKARCFHHRMRIRNFLL